MVSAVYRQSLYVLETYGGKSGLRANMVPYERKQVREAKAYGKCHRK